MIINIRGTSGSGKSTLVREVMRCYSTRHSIFLKEIEEGRTRPRKQPIMYLMTGSAPSLAVIGHYETECGGCDTISKMERIFHLAEEAAGSGHNVLFEGLLISADVVRTLALASKFPLQTRVIALDTPIEVCLAGVNDRRMRRMGEKYTPVKEDNTRAKHRGVQQSVERLRAHRVRADFYSREDALREVKEAFGLV